MLRPTKYSHPDQTVINVSLKVMLRLKKKRIDDFNNLRQYVKKLVKNGDVLFLPALNFLYLLGLIVYHPKNDSIEYINPYETV